MDFKWLFICSYVKCIASSQFLSNTFYIMFYSFSNKSSFVVNPYPGLTSLHSNRTFDQGNAIPNMFVLNYHDQKIAVQS